MALIVDTGPLYASLDRDEEAHRQCRELLDTFKEPLILPAPVLVEVEYLARTRLHIGISLRFLRDVSAGAWVVEDLTAYDYQRVSEICERYSDSEIGLVDAAVLAISERLNEPKVATLDQRNFRMFRPRHVDALTLLPD